MGVDQKLTAKLFTLSLAPAIFGMGNYQTLMIGTLIFCASKLKR